MPELTKNPTLKEFQKYVEELENERGFSHQTIIDKCLLLGEEVGELFKACLLYTSPSPRDRTRSRMPSSA